MTSPDNESLYKSFFDNAVDGLAYCRMIFDEQERPVDFVYQMVSQSFETITGLKEVVGKKVTEIIPGIATTNPELFEFYGRVALSGKSEKTEIYLEQLSKWFSISAYSFEKNFFAAVFTDITDEKREKEDLEKFELAADNAWDQIVITDPDGITLYINKAAERLTGYSSTEISGKKVGTLWGSLMPKEFYQNLWKTIKIDKESFVGELKNRRKSGEFYDAELKISPVLDDGNNILFFVGIERDISEEKRTLRMKDEFMSLASHQLRTPPSIIGWYTETLQAGDLGPVNEKQAAYLAEIYKANQRMVAIINSLLNISRLETNTFVVAPKKIDVKNIIDETVKELASRFNRKIEFKEEYDPATSSFLADPNILQIIIDNLLSNAFKYTPPENTKIEITVKMENDTFVLSVKDDGIGIPLKDQSRVFERLFRADNAVSANPDGTGIGLYMIKKIIDGLDGKIWFDSEENKGTTFYVSFPASGMKEKTGATVLARVSTIAS